MTWPVTMAEVLIWAFFLDFLLGDPRWLPHPTVGIGKLAFFLEQPLRRLGRRMGGNKGSFLAGLLLVLLVVGGSFSASFCLLLFLFSFSKVVGTAAALFLTYSTVAVKGLAQHALTVERFLAGGELVKARQAVGLLVSRDVTSLDAAGVARAAVESVAENTGDSVVAPLFYAVLGGIPLALAYRAANTLDAMYGYQDPRNLYFGRAAARLDDCLNYLPARLAAVLLLAGGLLTGKNMLRGWRVLVADGGKHQSPNSGRLEAAVAGVLGVRLGGPASYHGELNDLPYLNLAGRSPSKKDILSAVWLMVICSLLALFLGVVALLLLAGGDLYWLGLSGIFIWR